MLASQKVWRPTLSDIILERVTKRVDADWESFLDGPTDGSLFHRLSFLAYHPADRFTTHELRATRKGRTIAVIPTAAGDGEAQGGLGSPYGGSLGGWATAPGLGAADHRDLLEVLSRYARAEGFDSLWISGRPGPYRVHGDGAEFALQAAGARIVRQDVTHIADVTGDADAVQARVRGTSRRGARKAERLGTTTRAGERHELTAFHELVTADRARLDAAPTHTLAELEHLWDDRPTDYHLEVAENDGELVGAVLLFRATPDIALSFYTARADVPAAERCMNLLMEAALLDANQRGYRWLDFGTSSILGELNPGLSLFKEGFGGIPFVRETWRLPL